MKKYFNYIFVFLIPLTAIFFSVSNYTIQIAVDPALIINGDVQIPDKNAELYIFLKKQFSSIIQLSSFLLKIGLNIFQISKILISITYLSFFLGVYLCVKSLINNIFTDITSKIFSYIITFIMVIIAQLELGEGDYPVHYLTEHTYGLYGLAISTLLFGLIANGNFKFAFFLSTFFVSIHGTHGAWFSGILLLTIFIDRFFKKDFYKSKEIIIGSLIGTLFFIISFFYNYISFGPTEYFTVVESDSETIKNWIKYWEDHRSIPDFHIIYLLKSFLFFLFLLISIKFTNKYLNRNAEYLLILISVSIFFSSIIYVLYKIFFNYLPVFVMVPMPTRFLNVHSIVAWPVIFALFIVYIKLLSEKLKINIIKFYFGFFLILLLINMGNLNSYRKYFFYHYDERIGIKSFLKNNPFRTRIAQFYTMFFYDPREKLEDYDFWEYVKKVDKGYNWLSSAFLSNQVLRYGNQPYLFHPQSFDAVLVDQTVAKRTKKILENIYDLSYKNPMGNEEKFKDRLGEFAKIAYEKKNLDDWRAILNEFHVKYVVVPKDWKINLPLKLKGKRAALYVIE